MKKQAASPLCHDCYGGPSSDLSARNVRRAHWCKKTGHTSVTTEEIALGHKKNCIYMYLAFISNVLY